MRNITNIAWKCCAYYILNIDMIIKLLYYENNNLILLMHNTVIILIVQALMALLHLLSAKARNHQ